MPAASAGSRLPAVAAVPTRAASYAAGSEAVAAENVAKSGWGTQAAGVSWFFGGSPEALWRSSTTASVSARGWLAFGGTVGAGLIAVAVTTCSTPDSSSAEVSTSRSAAGASGRWEPPG